MQGDAGDAVHKVSHHDVNVIHININVGGIIALTHDSFAFTCAILKDNGGEEERKDLNSLTL